MGSFGERLRREREMRGISIEEIAEATKIGSRNLRALEEEHFDQLPGGIFNKGFVRAYSKYLGLDEEQAVADYVAAEGAFRDAAGDGVDIPVARSSGGSKALPWTIVLLVVIGAGGFFGWRFTKKKAMGIADREPAVHAVAQPAPAPAPVQQAPAATQPGTNPAQPDAAATPTAPTTTVPAATAPETATPDSAAADGFVVLVKASEDSWVSAKADGKPVLSGTLKATSEKTLRARDRIILTIGNAAGVQVSYNGKDQSFDRAVKVKTLVFTAQGLQPEVPEQRQ